MTKKPLLGENAKIVATLGPGSRSPKEVVALAFAGVDVFRLNFSHGEHAAHLEALQAVRAAEAKTGRPLAVLADLQGPKVRVGKFPDGSLRLGFRKEYSIVAAEEAADENTIPVPHAEIVEILEEGGGLLYESDSSAALARTLRRLAEERGLVAKLAATAPRVVSLDEHIGEVSSLYAEVLAAVR